MSCFEAFNVSNFDFSTLEIITSYTSVELATL